MSSVRVPSELLEKLNEAAPEGTSLARVIEVVLDQAGGPSAVREQLEQADRRQAAKARVARLWLQDHSSVILEPGEQVALAEAAARWCRTLEEKGQRMYDASSRVLELRPRRSNETSRSSVQPQGRFAREGAQR